VSCLLQLQLQLQLQLIAVVWVLAGLPLLLQLRLLALVGVQHLHLPAGHPHTCCWRASAERAAAVAVAAASPAAARLGVVHRTQGTPRGIGMALQMAAGIQFCAACWGWICNLLLANAPTLGLL
jgi:hypothetical protein